MGDGQSQNFVVRALDWKAIDGAFRVHLPPESLDHVGLKLGDLCQIELQNGGTKGYGIAWRATDKMGNAPKLKPAKMSDFLKTVLEVSDGNTVAISRTSAKLMPAEKIVLRDISPSDYGLLSDMEDNKWRSRCCSTFVSCEALACGLVFDVVAKKGLKRRFRIEYISSSPNTTGTSGLYFQDDNTHIEFLAPGAASEDTQPSSKDAPCLPTIDFGGLDEQLETLNTHIERVWNQTHETRLGPLGRPINEAVLIHGYEGTGKSVLLNTLGKIGFRKVVRIDKSAMKGSSVAKNANIITEAFAEARSHMPSVILLDDLDRLVPKNDDMYADVLSGELQKLEGTQILVVAACRSPGDIHSTLLDPGRFSLLIELPIPDLEARASILNILLDGRVSRPQEVSKSLSLRTHGFTGKDLIRLHDVAQRTVLKRRKAEVSRPIKMSAVSAAETHNHEPVARGSNHENLSHNEEATGEVTEVQEDEWNIALSKVRPTALREIFFEKPKVGWSDIGGSDKLKQRFDEIIGWPLHHPELIKQYGITPDKGVLLYGPPGCSKTLTAQAVATTYDLNFIAVKGAELISMYVGESERAVREMFRKARAAAPCVIFFDEIDAIASERDSSGTKGLNVLTTLLNEMDGFESLNGVLILAATNKPEALDPAIMRPGRFDSHIYLGPPDKLGRSEIFTISTRGQPLDDNLEFDQLLDQTQGYTGAEVVQICTHAKKEAARRTLASGEVAKLGMSDFQRAIQQTGRGVTEEMITSYESFAARQKS